MVIIMLTPDATNTSDASKKTQPGGMTFLGLDVDTSALLANWTVVVVGILLAIVLQTLFANVDVSLRLVGWADTPQNAPFIFVGTKHE